MWVGEDRGERQIRSQATQKNGPRNNIRQWTLQWKPNHRPNTDHIMKLVKLPMLCWNAFQLGPLQQQNSRRFWPAQSQTHLASGGKTFEFLFDGIGVVFVCFPNCHPCFSHVLMSPLVLYYIYGALQVWVFEWQVLICRKSAVLGPWGKSCLDSLSLSRAAHDKTYDTKCQTVSGFMYRLCCGAHYIVHRKCLFRLGRPGVTLFNGGQRIMPSYSSQLHNTLPISRPKKISSHGLSCPIVTFCACLQMPYYLIYPEVDYGPSGTICLNFSLPVRKSASVCLFVCLSCDFIYIYVFLLFSCQRTFTKTTQPDTTIILPNQKHPCNSQQTCEKRSPPHPGWDIVKFQADNKTSTVLWLALFPLDIERWKNKSESTLRQNGTWTKRICNRKGVDFTFGLHWSSNFNGKRSSNTFCIAMGHQTSHNHTSCWSIYNWFMAVQEAQGGNRSATNRAINPLSNRQPPWSLACCLLVSFCCFSLSRGVSCHRPTCDLAVVCSVVAMTGVFHCFYKSAKKVLCICWNQMISRWHVQILLILCCNWMAPFATYIELCFLSMQVVKRSLHTAHYIGNSLFEFGAKSVAETIKCVQTSCLDKTCERACEV